MFKLVGLSSAPGSRSQTTRIKIGDLLEYQRPPASHRRPPTHRGGRGIAAREPQNHLQRRCAEQHLELFLIVEQGTKAALQTAASCAGPGKAIS